MTYRRPQPAKPPKAVFTDIPLPSQFRRISNNPKPTPVVPIKPPAPAPVAAPLPKIDIPEAIIGGTPVAEEPKQQDKGDHVVEDLDLSDYK